MKTICFAIFAVLSLAGVQAHAQDEISLFDGMGKATAYVAVDDGMTIYLWDGKPAAYLEADSAGGYHVYGFNGKHLGWFVGGVVRDDQGAAACAVKERLQSTEYEPYKSYKQYKPYKAYKEYAPYRPFFSHSFGDTPCGLLLAGGEG